MRLFLTLFLFSILTTICMPPDVAAQDTNVISFSLSEETKKLVQNGDTPTLALGDKLIVKITNVHEARDDWKFSFGSLPLTQILPAESQPIRFESAKTTSAGIYRLTLIDSNEEVSLAIVNLQIGVTERKSGNGNKKADKKPYAGIHKTYDRGKNTVNLYFDENGLLYNCSIPGDVDDNDVINIFVVATKTRINEISVEVSGTIASGDFKILGEESLVDINNLAVLQSTKGKPPDEQLTVGNVGTFGPYESPSITININSNDSSDVKTLRSYPVRINKNYIAGLRFGIGKSDLRFNDYQIKSFAGSDATHIKNVADSDGEPRYYLSIVFYCWQFWEKSSWMGRDILEPPSFTDRINPFIGIGLNEPGEEFLFGVSFTVARGIDLIWSVQLAKTMQLNGGYAEGDQFDGEASSLPLEEEWKTNKNFYGCSIDLRIAARVLSSIFGNGS